VDYLVDANVLSEATKPRPEVAVLDWLKKHETELAVNPIVLGELQYGILLLSPGRKRKRLLDWFAAVVAHLPVFNLDGTTAAVWASLLADLKNKGRAMSIKDSLIAASAIQHRLAIATRNAEDFRHAGVRVENPFAV
jgi:predicted nucleic acid-binding protein